MENAAVNVMNGRQVKRTVGNMFWFYRGNIYGDDGESDDRSIVIVIIIVVLKATRENSEAAFAIYN